MTGIKRNIETGMTGCMIGTIEWGKEETGRDTEVVKEISR